MDIGDNVRVRASARHAMIIEDLGHSRYRVLFYSEPAADALDRDTVEDEDDAGDLRRRRSRSHRLIVERV